MRRAIVLLACCSVLAQAADKPLILGALEELPSFDNVQPLRRVVRALFERTDSGWRAFPSRCHDEPCLKTISQKYPAQVTWTIALSGRNLGKVTGEAAKTLNWDPEVGIENITSSGPVPTIGARAVRFGGDTMGQAVLRPLIAVSQPNVTDPDDWRPEKPEPWVIDLARAEFRKRFPKATNCRKEEGPEFSWKYSDANMKFEKAYSSRKRWHLISLEMTGDRCIRPRNESVTLNQWFLVTTAAAEVRWLGEGMWLVDAGDYDNDGRSEVIFAIDRYNRGGYELFYFDFQRHARFEYNFH